MAMAMRVVNITNNDFNFPVSSSSGEAMSSLSSSPPSASPLGQCQKQTFGKKFIGIAPKVVETKSNTSLANLWRQVQGSNNWDNLVEPLNPLLRQEIIRYGEFAGACYKAFDLDPNSKRYFNCKYGKERLFQEVGIQDSGYEITKYIYATPDVSIPTQNICGRWIGYVGVSTDEESKRLGRRDLMVAFRGTVTYPEWLANVMTSLTWPRFDPNNYRLDVKVEEGFLTLYTTKDEENKFGSGSCREQLLSEVQRLLNKYKGEEISITLSGHSMGSSLALLLAYDIAELELNRHESDDEIIPITVFSFAGPRVGNLGFKKRCEELGIKVLRIVNVNDPVTKMPGVFLNENFGFLGGKFKFPWSCSCYVHVGVEIALDFFTIENPICVHDLETYIEFLRCPYRSKEKRVDFIGGFISNAQNMYSLDWIGMGMVNIVFSTFICYWWMSVSIDVDQVIHFLR